MISYNYTSGYDFLSYMEYPVLLLQEYVLIYYAFKYQDLLGKRTQIVAILYTIIATLTYLKLFPIIILTFLVVSNTIGLINWLVLEIDKVSFGCEVFRRSWNPFNPYST